MEVVYISNILWKFHSNRLNSSGGTLCWPIYPQYSGVLQTGLALRYWFFEVLGSKSVKTQFSIKISCALEHPSTIQSAKFIILFRKIQCKNGYYVVLAAFAVRIRLKYGNLQEKRSQMFVLLHLHLPGPLRDDWTIGKSASCSNSLLGIRQMLMHEKICVIPILYFYFLLFIMSIEM